MKAGRREADGDGEMRIWTDAELKHCQLDCDECGETVREVAEFEHEWYEDGAYRTRPMSLCYSCLGHAFRRIIDVRLDREGVPNSVMYEAGEKAMRGGR